MTSWYIHSSGSFVSERSAFCVRLSRIVGVLISMDQKSRSIRTLKRSAEHFEADDSLFSSSGGDTTCSDDVEEVIEHRSDDIRWRRKKPR